MKNKNPVYKFSFENRFPRKDMHRISVDVFKKEVIKQLAIQGCDNFYLDDVPLYVGITLIELTPKGWDENITKSLCDKNKPMFRGPNADQVANLILDALGGMICSHKQQFSKVVIKKRFGWKETIEIEIGVDNG